MRRTLPAVALLALTLTGCDDRPEEVASTPGASPTSTPDGLPTDPGTGSAAPAPDPPGPESVPTPSEQLDGP